MVQRFEYAIPSHRTDLPKSRPGISRYHRSIRNLAAGGTPASNESILMGRTTEDEAEATLLAVLEERRQRAQAEDDGWDASVQGERPPLHGVPMDTESYDPSLQDEAADAAEAVKEANWFSSLAKRANDIGMHRVEHHTGEKTTEGVFEGVAANETETGASEVALVDTATDLLITGAIAIDDMFNQADDLSVISEDWSVDSGGIDEETLPLTGSAASSPGDFKSSSDPNKRRNKKKSRRRRHRKTLRRCLRRVKRIFKVHGGKLTEVLHPVILFKQVANFVLHSWFTWIGVPCLITAAFLYYHLSNPILDFIPEASVSWYLIFIARQTLTFQLAAATQYLMVDALAMRSRTVVNLLGPLPTLVLIVSKGWPLVAVCWSLWDLLLLQGNNEFNKNWLFFLDIEMLTEANPGWKLINGSLYFRMLMSVLIAGAASAVKRSVVALYFGKKTYVQYKPRLEELLGEVVLVAEVAELASQAKKAQKTPDGSIASRPSLMGKHTKWSSLKAAKSPVKTVEEIAADEEADDTESDAEAEDDDDDDGDEDENGEDQLDMSPKRPAFSRKQDSQKFLKRTLQQWDDPVSNNDQIVDVSIADILQFRKALSFMDDAHPFSLSFGSAQTRDECIRSARNTYRNLMKYQKGRGVLSFDVINLLSCGPDDDEEDIEKENALRNLFLPDQFNEVSLLAFAQACDLVYKELRYFRASVGNSSLIDNVLEGMIDNVFSFILVLVLLTVLQYNPWPLLVSMTTLVVSFAFAIGPSVSKYIEGVLLIVVRQPFDLGDRIVIMSSTTAATHQAGSSWLVEDTTLFATTLRYVATNEVASVNNGVIAQGRIVNLARSSNALVNLNLRFCLRSMTGGKADLFREAITRYVTEHPRDWDRLMFFRCDKIDSDSNLIEYNLRVRHTMPWQELLVVNAARSGLNMFCYELGEKLGILYTTPADQQVILLGKPLAASKSLQGTKEEGSPDLLQTAIAELSK